MDPRSNQLMFANVLLLFVIVVKLDWIVRTRQ